MGTRVRRRDRLGVAYRFAVVVLWPILRTCFTWEIRGLELLEQEPGGIIVAANHNSWVDPLVVSYPLWLADRPPRFLAKEPLFRAPVIGAIIRNAGQIPVYRDTVNANHAIRDALTALDRGECIVIYPEGTMTRDPDLWPMKGKTGAVRIALASGRPLYPMAQWGATEVMAPYTKELHLFPRKTMKVLVGPPVDLSDLMGREPDAEVLAVGTARLIAAISTLLGEIRGEEPPAEPMSFRRTPE